MSTLLITVAVVLTGGSLPPGWETANVALPDGSAMPAYVHHQEDADTIGGFSFVPRIGEGHYYDFGQRFNKTLTFECTEGSSAQLVSGTLRCTPEKTAVITPNITLPHRPDQTHTSRIPPVVPWGKPVVQDPRFWIQQMHLVLGGMAALLLLAWWSNRRAVRMEFPEESNGPPPWSQQAWIGCGVATAIAVVLRFIGLDMEPLEQNEFTYFMSGMGHTSIGDVMLDVNAMAQTHPPLFHGILYVFSAFGNTEWIARLPAALAGVGAVPLTFAVAWRFVDGKWLAASVAALAAAVSPVHVWYSQDVSPYTLMALFALVLLWSTDAAIRRPSSRRPWWGIILSSWGLFYSHYYGLHLTISCFAVLGWMVAKRQMGWRAMAWRTLSTGAVLAAGLLVWLPAFVEAYLWSKGHSTAYQREVGVYHNNREFFADILDVFRLMGGFSLPWKWLALGGVAMGIVHWRLPSLSTSRRLLLVMPFVWFFPFELLNRETFLHSLYDGYYFGIRYMLFLFPVAWVLGAVWVSRALEPTTRAWIKWPTYVTAASVLIAGLLSSWGQIHRYDRPDVRGAAAYVHQHIQDGDAVIVGPAVFYQHPYHYYRVPLDQRAALGINDYMQTPRWHGQWVGVLSELFEDVSRSLDNVHIQRVWLLDHEQHLLGRPEFSRRPAEHLMKKIEANFEPVADAEQSFHDVTLRLYQRRGPITAKEPIEHVHFGWTDRQYIRRFWPPWTYANPGRVVQPDSQVTIPVPSQRSVVGFRLRLGTVRPPNTKPETMESTVQLRLNGVLVKTVLVTEAFQEVTVDLTNAEAITTFSLQFGLTRPKQDSGRPADVVLDWLQLQYDQPVSLVDARG